MEDLFIIQASAGEYKINSLLLVLNKHFKLFFFFFYYIQNKSG